MKLLDLFCGAGGASQGYADAGFEVVGVDLVASKNYPFELVQSDVMDLDVEWMRTFDAIHASPPCQHYSHLTKKWGTQDLHEGLISKVRVLLNDVGKHYVIENVEGARNELIDPIRLCGSTFGLDVRRHRFFETSFPIAEPPCNHDWQIPRFPIPDKRQKNLARVVPVTGNLNYAGDLKLRQEAMGINWMTNKELVESIPPRYTQFIGWQLYAYLKALFH